MMERLDLLRLFTFGQRVAEEESNELANYFVETDQWRRLLNGELDIIYGPKGSGKSALYLLLNKKSNDLYSKKIIIVPAENLRGAPAFRSLAENPPQGESEFRGLWKLYILSLVGSTLQDRSATSEPAKKVINTLKEAGLLKGGKSLRSHLSSVFSYISSLRPNAIESDISIDPTTTLPTLTGRIVLNEPNSDMIESGYISVDELLDKANEAFLDLDHKIWLLFDRLDIAFSDRLELEESALRSLFRTYLDLLPYENIRVKIFIRSDIWSRLTSAGFREASHITRSITISWDRSSLLNLVIRRILQNKEVCDYYSENPNQILGSIEEQDRFFYKLFPKQIDIGPNKSKTFDWMIGRTRDGTGETAPRELIHLLNATREIEISHLERGDLGDERESDVLFTRPSIKSALPMVSKTRLEQTLYAEYPGLRIWLEKLDGEKTLHTLDTLSRIWEVSKDQAKEAANQLVDIGFFEPKGSKESPKFRVPFLYRDALNMIQGTAESD